VKLRRLPYIDLVQTPQGQFFMTFWGSLYRVAVASLPSPRESPRIKSSTNNTDIHPRRGGIRVPEKNWYCMFSSLGRGTMGTWRGGGGIRSMYVAPERFGVRISTAMGGIVGAEVEPPCWRVTIMSTSLASRVSLLI